MKPDFKADDDDGIFDLDANEIKKIDILQRNYQKNPFIQIVYVVIFAIIPFYPSFS